MTRDELVSRNAELQRIRAVKRQQYQALSVQLIQIEGAIAENNAHLERMDAADKAAEQNQPAADAVV